MSVSLCEQLHRSNENYGDKFYLLATVSSPGLAERLLSSPPSHVAGLIAACGLTKKAWSAQLPMTTKASGICISPKERGLWAECQCFIF